MNPVGRPFSLLPLSLALLCRVMPIQIPAKRMEKEEPGFPPDQPASRRDSHGEPAENSVSTHKARSENNIDTEQTKGISVAGRSRLLTATVRVRVGQLVPGEGGHYSPQSKQSRIGPRKFVFLIFISRLKMV